MRSSTEASVGKFSTIVFSMTICSFMSWYLHSWLELIAAAVVIGLFATFIIHAIDLWDMNR